MRKTEQPLRETVSLREASIRLGISRGTALKLATTGELPGVVRLGRNYRVATAALDRVLCVDREATEEEARAA